MESEARIAKYIMTELRYMGFFEANASHYGRSESLASHTANVIEKLLRLMVVGLFHDLYKCEMCKDGIGVRHCGDKSVILSSTIMRLSPEEMFCIKYHMVTHSEIRAIKLFKNILWTHHADMLALCGEE